MSHNQQPVTDSGAQKRNPFDYIADDDDDFGDFTSAVSFTHSLNGGFHSAPRPPAVTNNGSVFFNPLPLAPQDEIEEDDEFGDFCAQPSVRIEEPVVVPAVKCQPNYNIDLEIDSCLSWNEPLPAIAATVQQQQPELEIEEEEFSQFTSAPEPPTEAPVDLFDSQPVGGGDLFSLTNDVTSLLVLEPTPTVEAVQVAVVEDEFGDFEQAVINEEPLDLVVPLVLFNPVQETTEMQPTEEDHSSVHVISEIIVDPVPVEPSPLPQIPVEEEKDDDFGDFASFQQAAEQVVFEQEDDDDGYDDYEIARPPPVDGLASLEVEEDIQQTSEVRLKRLLNTIFPYAEPAAVATSSPTCLSPLSSRGALWSYVSQLDSTPALSFQWRHSTAHQRFLNSIKIDSIQQQFQSTLHPAKWHWPSPTSSANSSSVGESLSESSISGPSVSALDLDFFLNPSNTSTASAPAVNANSLLESIERELLSSPTKTITSTVQSPPVHHHHHQMDDIWGHHNPIQTTAQGAPTVANVLDLLH